LGDERQPRMVIWDYLWIITYNGGTGMKALSEYIQSFRRFKRFMLILLFSVFLWMNGCLFLPEEEEALTPPVLEPPAVEYQTVTAAKGNLERKINVTGYVRLTDSVDLSFKEIDGRVKEIYKKIGDWAEKGELLIELENDAYAEGIQKAEIQVRKMELELKNAEKTRETETALAAFELQELEDKLSKMQSNSSIYPSEQIDELKNQLERKRISYAILNNKFDYALQKAELDLEEARLNLEKTELELQKTMLKSPLSGEITFITNTSIGSMVNRDDVLVRVSSPSNKLIQYKGDKAAFFVKGMKVSVTLEGRQYQGKVLLSSDVVPKDAPESFQNAAYIRLDKGLDAKVPEGTAAEIEVIFEKREDVVILPTNCLKTREGRYYVTVLNNGVKYSRDVEVGLMLPAQAEIMEGLQEGEIVVIR
jgi:macrolide-specific efflux system membrane fusion protein